MKSVNFVSWKRKTGKPPKAAQHPSSACPHWETQKRTLQTAHSLSKQPQAWVLSPALLLIPVQVTCRAMGFGVGIGTLRRKEGCVASTSDLTENSELILAMRPPAPWAHECELWQCLLPGSQEGSRVHTNRGRCLLVPTQLGAVQAALWLETN